MKLHKYYFGFYEHYEILDDNHVECVIKDTTSNKYYQKSYEFVQDKFSGICLTEIKWSIKDILIIILIVLSIPILIVMLYQSINIDVDETFEPTLILMLSILIHELGHSTALRLFGKKAVSYKFLFISLFNVIFLSIALSMLSILSCTLISGISNSILFMLI